MNFRRCRSWLNPIAVLLYGIIWCSGVPVQQWGSHWSAVYLWVWHPKISCHYLPHLCGIFTPPRHYVKNSSSTCTQDSRCSAGCSPTAGAVQPRKMTCAGGELCLFQDLLALQLYCCCSFGSSRAWGQMHSIRVGKYSMPAGYTAVQTEVVLYRP